MDFSADSISNSVSKKSVVEETSLFMAGIRDAGNRTAYRTPVIHKTLSKPQMQDF